MQVSKFVRFFAAAYTVYDLHAPLAFQFAMRVLEDRRRFYIFDEVETLRSFLKQDDSIIEVTDLGAGSQFSEDRRRPVKEVVQNAATHPIFCRMLFRLIQWQKPKNMLELGTSLGVSTLYQAAANIEGKLWTVEGCPNTASLAKKHFRKYKAHNIYLHLGSFRDQLPAILSEMGRVDYLFLDGHHNQTATLEYFEQILPYAHHQTVIVIDDIHWSAGMERAWRVIQEHPMVSMTIDLFAMGVVFFRKEIKQKQHYKLVPARWKPWRMGFFR